MLDNHIGLWAGPRSRSTVLARSFEQRNDCVVFDEPFYAAYLVSNGFRDPVRDAILKARETDPDKITAMLQRPLPEHLGFALQKHISKNIMPEFGERWLPARNVFLIRDPHEVVASLLKVMGTEIVYEDIDLTALLRDFKRARVLTGETPLVVDSTEVIKDPPGALRRICAVLGIPFSTSMLSWKADLEGSSLFFTGALLPYAESWYGSVMHSTSFRPYEEKSPVTIPDRHMDLVNACEPVYQELRSHALAFD